MFRLVVQLPEIIYKWLQAESKRTGESMASIIREAVRNYITEIGEKRKLYNLPTDSGRTNKKGGK